VYPKSNLLIEHLFKSSIDRSDEVAQVTMLLAVVCTVIMGVSRRGGDIIMGQLSVLLCAAWRQKDGALDASHANILAQLPKSMTTVLSKFNLDGHVTIYAVCPICHYTYKLQYKTGSTIPIYPERCNHKPRPDSDICNEPLLQSPSKNGPLNVPVKPFAYYNFMDYLAGLLSHMDIEEMLDNSCDRAMELLSYPPPTFVKNVFEADFVHSFEGPDTTLQKKLLFIDRPHGEGRFIFNLNIDFFHPEGMHIRVA
jgi:hypothetical protein